MKPIFPKIIIGLTLIIQIKCQENPTRINSTADWSTTMTFIVKDLWNKCSSSQQGFNKSSTTLDLVPIAECLKRKCITVLARAIQMEKIPLYYGVELVKSDNVDTKSISSRVGRDHKHSQQGWSGSILNGLVKLFDTHVLKLNVDGTDKWSQTLPRRRHRRQMNAIMFFGFVAMIMILIPLGFKFLTILGTKALLLAKMALLLSSIQGLKRIATSSINYGLYQQPAGLTPFGPYGEAPYGSPYSGGYDHM